MNNLNLNLSRPSSISIVNLTKVMFWVYPFQTIKEIFDFSIVSKNAYESQNNKNLWEIILKREKKEQVILQLTDKAFRKCVIDQVYGKQIDFEAGFLDLENLAINIIKNSTLERLTDSINTLEPFLPMEYCISIPINPTDRLFILKIKINDYIFKRSLILPKETVEYFSKINVRCVIISNFKIEGINKRDRTPEDLDRTFKEEMERASCFGDSIDWTIKYLKNDGKPLAEKNRNYLEGRLFGLVLNNHLYLKK